MTFFPSCLENDDEEWVGDGNRVKRNSSSAIRQVHLVRSCPSALLSADIFGELTLHDLERGIALQDAVDQNEVAQGLFSRHAVAISEAEFPEKVGFIAVAFASLSITLFLSHKK